MIRGLAWLLVCQAVGEVLAILLRLPVPGPVVGMVLLFAGLTWRGPAAETHVMRAGDALLRHLQLFFVPAGAGLVVYLTVLRDGAAAIAAGLIGSWLLGLLAVGWIVAGLVARGRREESA